MRKKIIILLVLCMMLVTTTVTIADPVETIEINYKDDDIFFLSGNITIFPGNTSDLDYTDLTMTKILYSTTENVTVYKVKSNEIEYDWTFVNNTKNYTYITNTAEEILVKVDYSSIDVPVSWEDILNETVEEKDTIILSLLEEMDILSEKMKEVNATLSSTIIDLNKYKATTDILTEERDDAKSKMQSYKNKATNLELNNSQIQNELDSKISLVNDLRGEIVYLEELLNDISGGWALGYEYKGKTFQVFGWIWFFVGVFTCIILLVVFINKVRINKFITSINSKRKKVNEPYRIKKNFVTTQDDLKNFEINQIKEENKEPPQETDKNKFEPLKEYNTFIQNKMKEGMKLKEARRSWKEYKKRTLVKK